MNVGDASTVVQARDIHGGVHIHAAPQQATPVEGQVVVGLIPYEPPNFQEPAQVSALVAMTGEVCVVCAVTGQRGVGKTQVAAAYARQRIRDGWLVAWTAAESADLIKAGMTDLADRLGLRDPEDDIETTAAKVREHLQTRAEPALLVFDNLVELDAIIPHLPAAGRTQVLITSTVRGAERMGRAVPVDVFDLDTALRFMRQATGLDDDQGARTLATELGFLPLALAQAAARIRAGWDYPTYLDHLRRYPVNRYLTRRAGDSYPFGAPAAILLALEPFYEKLGSPIRVLETVAVLSPDGVSREILAVGADDPAATDDDLERLYEASIVEFAGDATRAVTMHRLVQRVIRDRCRLAGTYPQVISRQTERLASLIFDEKDAWQLKQRGDELVRQIEALWANSAHHPEITDLSIILALRMWAVRHLIATAALSRAIPLARTVANEMRSHLGDDHLDTLRATHHLARAYRSAGRLVEAIPLYEQTLTDRRRILGDDHPNTLSAANSLAYAYRSAGRLGEAIPLYEQTLTSMRQILGDDHLDTLTAANNLASAYQSAGRLGEAIPLYEQTLSDRRQVLGGGDDPDSLAAANNLASAYQSAGRLGEAIPLYEQTLTNMRQILGHDHPLTLTAALNLAGSYRSAGRVDEAILLNEQTLTNMQRTLGDDHSDTLTAANNLAKTCQSVGRLGDAIALYTQILTIRRQVLGGGDDPDTLAAANNLASAYQSAGRLGEAIPLYEQTLTNMRQILGHDHPHTLIAANNLAYAYRSTGRLDEAIPLYEQTFTNNRRILGDSHPNTLTAANNLASAYDSADRLGQAIPLYEQTLTNMRRTLGHIHPHTLIAAIRLAYAYEAADRLGEAIPLCEQTLTEGLGVLEVEHPVVEGIRKALAILRRGPQPM